MSNFITALMKQRKDAKKEEPNVGGRLKEVLAVLKKYNYDDGITPEIVVNILTDLGPTFVKIGQIASQQAEYLPREYCDALATLRSNSRRDSEPHKGSEFLIIFDHRVEYLT